jgi:tetratricopeptide (TPR) repeat protein
VAGEEGDSAITVTGTRSRYAPPRRRGDWNACTIDDPGRDPAACRKPAGAAAKGASGASSQIAEGVSQGWEGDLEEAIASFDRAIELEPRSSDAYLNRALARRRLGDLDGALADLDRAVRYAPRAARYYYQRSLVLHQRGDHRRAESDEERAVALDPRYRVAVKGAQ